MGGLHTGPYWRGGQLSPPTKLRRAERLVIPQRATFARSPQPTPKPRQVRGFLLGEGLTYIILASGPSMTRADAEYCRGRGFVIAINNTVELAPWADALYSCDPSWWLCEEYKHLHRNFRGRKLGLNHPAQPAGVERIDYAQNDGLGLTRINTGHNSGFQAINWAYLQGARRIVLLGLDMGLANTHWHPNHPKGLGNFSIPDMCRPLFTPLANDLARLGVTVINASRQTTLTCFERRDLAKAFD